MYETTAHLYDVIYSHLDYKGLADSLVEIVNGKKPDASSWLDVACGTGVLLGHLKDRYESQGIDVTQEMLDVAKGSLPDVALHLGDMRDFDLGRRFDVVTCMFSSIGYAITVENLNRALARMAAHTVSGGVVIIEPWIFPDQYSDTHLHADFVDRPEIKLARMSSNERVGRLTKLSMHHLVGTLGRVEHIVDHHELFMFTDAEYSEAFEAAGMAVELVKGGLAARGLYVGVA